MFEKLLDLFFKADDEDEEVNEPVKEDEITLKDFETKKEVEEKVEPVKETVLVEPVIEKVEVKTKPAFDVITADGPIEKPKKKVRITRREEYDLQPVISPYFGVKGDNKPTLKVERKPAATYRKEVKKSEYSEVISPIYGVKEKAIPVQSEVVKKVEPEKNEPEFLKAKRVIEVPSFDMMEEEENIALDDILFSKDNGEDDMIQFSLFGDDKRIQEDVFKNEDMDDDSLPF